MARNPLCFFLLLVHYSAILRGQNAELNLIRTSFWAPKEDNTSWIVIKKDADGTAISGITDTKAWVLNADNTVTIKPVGYASGCHPRVSACFRKTGVVSSCPPTGANAPALGAPKYYGRGIVVDDANQPINDMKFPEKPLAQTTNLETYEYPASDMEQVFPEGIIRYYAKFRIRWEWALSPDSGANWQTVGFSENPMYVTRQKPKAEETTGYAHFLTLLHIGCTNANGVNGITNENIMIQKIWEEFTDLNVYVVGDNMPMKYYGQWLDGNLATRTDELLIRKDGECTAWVKFFLDVLKIQGFKQDNNRITLRPAISVGFFIKSWEKSVQYGSSNNPQYPFVNKKKTPFYLLNTYNWEISEVEYVSPSQAQGLDLFPYPVANFGQHVVAGIYDSNMNLNLIYDPSYGQTYSALPALQSEFSEVVSCYYMLLDNDNTFNLQINYSNNENDYITIYEKRTY